MEQIDVTSFEELEKTVIDVAKRYKFDDCYTISEPGAILYRGQSNSEWGLKTTLSRNSEIKSLRTYLALCGRVQPVLETEYEITFSRILLPDIEKILTNISDFSLFTLPWFDYLLYLRHNGFPSPFLDWTQSLYLALGFAFFSDYDAPYRSVYMYLENPSKFKIGSHGEPTIYRIGQYVKTSRRHFLQQSMYTICYSLQSNDVNFESYELIKKPDNHDQDVLIKLIIPSFEREKILKFLFSVNITPYTIMPNEENLIKTLWLKEHQFRQKI